MLVIDFMVLIKRERGGGERGRREADYSHLVPKQRRRGVITPLPYKPVFYFVQRGNFTCIVATIGAGRVTDRS